MTASALRQWATTRVSAPPERAPSLQLLGSAADLRIEQPPKATEAPDTERNTSTVLKDVVEALSKVGGGTGAQLRPSTAVWLLSVGVEPIGLVRGDPGAVRIFNNAASRAVLDAVREVSDRPGFREFKAIETRAGSRGDLPRSVVRAVAIALLDKMNGESAVASSVARHRRSALKAPLGAADLSAPRPPQDAANADGRSADAPL
jgi:hypothetical protein